MTSPATAGTAGITPYDPDDPELRVDPYPTYARLRAQAPQQDRLGVWVFSRYSDITQVLRSRAFTSDPYGWDLYPEVAEAIYGDLDCPLLVLQRAWLMLRDGDEHRAARRLFARALSTERIEQAAAHAGRTASSGAARLAARGGGDFMREVAGQVPLRAICSLLSLPYADGVHSRNLMDRILLTFGLSGTPADTVREANDATTELVEYFGALIDDRLAHPGEDLLSEILRTSSDALTRDEWVANTILLFAAGHETTINLLGNGCLALLRHPEQLALLRQRPDLAARVVEEALRYDGPQQVVSRSAVSDVRIGKVTVAAGEHVALLLGAGNRDPEQFENPDVFDIRRGDAAHLAFGGGAHFCLGAKLARSEASAAFAVLGSTLHRASIVEEDLAWAQTTAHRGLQRLPLKLPRPPGS